MRATILTLALAMGLAACDGENPFDPIEDAPEDVSEDEENEAPDDPETPIDSDGTLPPGTASPTPGGSVFRSEALDDDGAGFARGIAYDAESDTFAVDNLAFDGAGSVYERGGAVSSLGPFAVYESDAVARDQVSGAPVDQLVYRAIYGVSRSGRTEFAIVRTGSFVEYGFGGFVYQRNGGVDLPESGQGFYSGDYAGMRTFGGEAGLEYTTADITLQVDFDDFDSGAGLSGLMTNRRIFDLAGQDLTQSVIESVNAEFGASLSALPTVRWVISPDAVNANGEATGGVFSTVTSSSGEVNDFESGTYYAVMAGPDAGEIAGIVVIDGTDYRGSNAFDVRETGGFIVTR